MRLFDTFIFLFAIAPGFALFLLFLPLIKAKVNLPNRKGRKRIIRMNPMPWEWIEEKGMLSHVLLLNYNIEYAIAKDKGSKNSLRLDLVELLIGPYFELKYERFLLLRAAILLQENV